MKASLASTFAYLGSVAAATLAAAAFMTGEARAEGPIEVLPAFTGTLSRAEVRSALMAHPAQLTSAASEWRLQQGETLMAGSSTTRAQVRAEYIASREQVRAMNGEDGGAAYLASAGRQARVTVIAGNGMR
ncbi:hypothetical protein [Ramlibacter alkalitolerans]|uniref:DUF4148 domain-containing protein n=1 Tax=Ramlibacter alkalitolerans TaxID=2039631 RepID=A0ABS1JI50_9BURK|nr:hypothetical protein [Ramlibacter alkalitolerans]MBL0423480.1 hypothetical protein [Ramlibacter alkalitolerans]